MKGLFFCGRWFCLGVCAALTVFRASAQRPNSQQENRFLIIVETSTSMRRCSNAVAQAVTELFQSEMKGELRPGDTIGLWSYGESVHTDFPMQIWKGTNAEHVQHNVMAYLRDQRYEKKGRLDTVLGMVGNLMVESHRLTMIFIFDGTEPIKGTRFDTDINDLHKKFRSEFRAKHVPFVTALSARDGNIFDYTVCTPGSIKLPHTALPYQPAPTNTAPVAVVAPPALVPVLPPAPHKHIEIVMSGATANSARPAVPAAAEPVVAPTNEVIAAGETNSTVVAATIATPRTNVISEPKIVVESLTNASTNASVMAVVPAPPSTRPPPTAPVVLPAAAVAPPAAAPPTRTNAALFALFIIAFSLLAIAGGLFWSLARRSRGAGSPSLISQSMDRSR